MILVRDVFRLEFGRAREAVALCQEGLAFIRDSGVAHEPRLLTDLTGPYYTLVLEATYDDLAAFEGGMRRGMGDEGWRAWYQRFVPLVDSGYRELFTVVGTPVPPLAAAPDLGRQLGRSARLPRPPRRQGHGAPR